MKSNPKREYLKSLSEQVREVVASGEYTHVNAAILDRFYKDDQHTEFHTFRQWKKKGFGVRKGEKAFVLWARPQEVERKEPQEGQDEKFEFFPLCHLFSNAQVEQNPYGPTDEPATVNEPKMAYEIGIVYKSTVPANSRKKISSSKCVADFMQPIFGESIEHKELFYALLLNRANRVIAYYKVSEGGLSGCVVDIRHIMQAAILANAAGIIVSHNHPSGNTTPSQADNNITYKLKESGTTMDIPLIDHVIVTAEGQYYSYADEGSL